MVKVDLITGFLGSGKTTFITKYVKYLMSIGERICILENDFGSINVDMMLLADLGCDREMVIGGDFDCHKRRFKTKLITMAIKGYTRVIIEPSGIFDTDEFFDLLYEDPLNDLYEIGNVFCLYDINTNNLSYESKYFLVSEASPAAKLIISKRKNNETVDLNYINSIMAEFDCKRIFTENDILYNDSIEFDKILNLGYKNYSFIKPVNIQNINYDSVYYLNKKYNKDVIINIKNKLFNDKDYGKIVRIKGFIKDDSNWIKINITNDSFDYEKIDEGQEVIIIIGENLNKEKIDLLFNNR